MAGWMKVEHDTPDKQEILAIAGMLDVSPDDAFGKCFRLWRWFDLNSAEGNAPGVTFALLDRYLGATNLCESLEKVGWIVQTDDGISLPNFHYHNGSTAKKRAQTARRVKTYKDKRKSKKGNAKGNAKGNGSSVTPSFSYTFLLSCSSCKEEEYKDLTIPVALQTEAFKEAWDAWCKHRTEIKKPLTPTSVRGQLKRLDELGLEAAIERIWYTIEKGWQGMREPDSNGQSKSQRPTGVGFKHGEVPVDISDF